MAGATVVLVNYGHPLTAGQGAAVETAVGAPVRTIQVPAQFDHDRPFADQARDLADAAGLTQQEWQGTPILVGLPTLHNAAAALLAELHGRCGHFPAVVRLRPIAGAVPPSFEVAEIMDLQGARNQARDRTARNGSQ